MNRQPQSSRTPLPHAVFGALVPCLSRLQARRLFEVGLEYRQGRRNALEH